MLRNMTFWCCAALCVCVAETRAANEAQELYDSLFAPKVKDAIRTPDKADDVAVAQEMLTVAKEKSTPGDLALLLADEAYKLASRDTSGFDAAAEALLLTAKLDKSKAEDTYEKLGVLRNRQFLSARGDDRADAGEKLINAYFMIAFMKFAGDDKDSAIAYMRRASAVATRINSDRQDKIQETIDRMVNEQRLAGRIDILKTKIKNGDKAAAQDLLELYVIELDDPEEARKYTFLVEDEAWKTNVALAAKSPETLEAGEALTLGNWYRTLAGGPSGAPNRAAMYTRAHQYYVFATSRELEGADKLKATLGLSAVDASLKNDGVDPTKIKPIKVRSGLKAPVAEASPGAEPGAAGNGPVGVGAPIDLLQGVDVMRDAGNGRWRLDGRALVNEGSQLVSIALPVAIDGEYKLRMKATRLHGNESANVFLPVGDASCQFILGGFENTLSGFQPNDANTLKVSGMAKQGAIENDRAYDVEFVVRISGDAAHVSATIDGEALPTWKGPIGDARRGAYWRLPYNKAVGLGVYQGAWRFSDLTLTMISGSATPVRGGGPGGPAGSLVVVPNPKLPELQPMLTDMKQRRPQLFDGVRRLQAHAAIDAGDLGVSGMGERVDVDGSYAPNVWKGAPSVKDFVINGRFSSIPPGDYLAVYRVRHAASGGGANTLCTIELTDGATKFADETVTFDDAPSGAWSTVGFRFKLDKPTQSTARVWQNARPVWVDRIYIFRVNPGFGPGGPGGPGGPNRGAGPANGGQPDVGEAIRNAFERKFVEGIGNAYRNAGPQQKPFILNGIRQKFNELPEDKRKTVLEVLKENGNDELLRELQGGN